LEACKINNGAVATHFHLLTVKDIRKETPDCISIAFDIPAGLQKEFEYTQGQNITIKKTIGGEELRRSYSICSSPYDKELRVAVKHVAQGKFSAWANSQLTKNELLEVLPPTGKFFTQLKSSNKKNYIAFAAGSGITPLLSIIKTTLLTEPGSRFTLVYGNRNRSSVIFKEALDALKNKFINRLAIHHILSREKTDIPLHHGRIDADKCENIFQHLMDIKSCDEFFLCGPEEMIFCVKDYLEKKGVEKKKIHFELFTTPGQKKLEAGTEEVKVKKEFEGKSSKVTIKLDGIAVDFNLPFNGDAILDAALKLGADLPFACKGGVCATCRAKLVEGKVEMDNNYALEPEELMNGFVLTCQSHPRTERVIIDYDAK
jgi:ring-1,2-phenylacetyl-CoA epoxidase subunit PaaE